MFQRGPERPYVAAVVPAAGMATRMRGIDKQFAQLGELPVLAHTLLALSASEWIDEIVVVVRRGDIPDTLTLVQACGIPKVRSVVAGGESRQQSVRLGLEAVSACADYLLVHDGARPLVSGQVIAEAVLAAFGCGAATAAVPVADTIKEADGEGMVVATRDRSRLYAVQTPQVFELGAYRAAAERAAAEGKEYTDDCQMLEAAGRPVRLSRGSHENLKITTPVDLAVAWALMEQREGEAI